MHFGYKLNRDKSEVKPLNVHCTREILGNTGLAWQPGYISYLGIEFGSNIRDTLLHNKVPHWKKLRNF